MSVKDKILHELALFFKTEVNEFHENTVASDIPGWDSLAHVELLLTLESRFNISFELSELMMMNTVGDLCSIIESKIYSEPGVLTDTSSMNPL